MTPGLLVERLLSEDSWKPLGSGIEYQLSGDSMTVFVPGSLIDVPEQFRQDRAETVALDAINSDAFPTSGPWSLQDSSEVMGTLHPNSEATGWNVYFKDTSKMEPDYTD